MDNTDMQATYRWPVYWAQTHLDTRAQVGDPVFAEAVKDWQTEHDLPVDGLLGPVTYGSMRLHTRDPLRSDIEWLARIITCEMGDRSGASEAEAEAVGWTVINRMQIDPTHWGAYPEQVALGVAYARGARDPGLCPDKRAERLAKILLSEYRRDPTQGCTHFYSPRSMPSADAPEWPGELHARRRRYYQADGKYFLWTGKRKLLTSTAGGWVEVTDDDGRRQTRAQPRFAARMTEVRVPGVRPWWARFFRS